jgi:GTP cyclohydrolase I
MRGVKKKGFITKTSIKKGTFVKNADLLDQFYRDIGEKIETRN